ncbi:MAG: DUF2240 family protein [Candidatus Pacearchaeota archaeon]
MINAKIDEIIEKIAKIAKTDKEEVKRRIEAKKAALSGLISYEGAAQIVAAELGIKFDSIKLNIADLLPGMRHINVIGKIIELYKIQKFVRGGKEQKLASFLFADATDCIRVVLWDTKHIALIEEGKLKEGDTVEISKAYVRGDVNSKELHLTGISDISLSSIKLEQTINKETRPFRFINQLTTNSRVKIKANIVHAFKPMIYDFCPICNKKAGNCEHESFEKRIVFAFIVDDGTSNIRCIAFTPIAMKILGLANKIEDLEVEARLVDLLGEEFWLTGRVRKNTFRDALELVVEDAEQVDVKELIEKLQSSSLK